MSEHLEEMVLVLEDAAYIRRERLNGDPNRGPDETTEEDVVEAMMRRKSPPEEILKRGHHYTRALRIILKSIDQQG